MTTPPLVALERLMAGNRRFVAGQLRHPHGDARHREHVAEAQHPIAIVVCCSDSREVPELIFDCGLGDLFVVRTAGHCVGETALASVEFGAMVLGVELVVVLGHTKCGAVAATLSARHELDAPAGHIPALLHMIRPAMDEALISTPEHDLPESVMRIHVRRTAAALADIPSKPLVVGGRYDLATGAVTILD